jgi:hypothetical protein
MATLLASSTIQSAPQAFETPNLHFQTNFTYFSKGRQVINFKLDTFRLSEVQYDSLPLAQVLESLSGDLKYRDVDGSGINFIISSNDEPLPPPPQVDPSTGLQIEAVPPDLTQLAIRIMPALRDATLRQTLDAILRGADQPIKYSVEDYGIVFSWRAPERLATRWFRVDPDTLVQGAADVTAFWVGTGSSGESELDRPEYARLNILASLVEIRRDAETGRRYYAYASALPRSGRQHVTIAMRGDQIISAARLLFTGAGVDFTQPGKQLFFNDRLGLLMVRATLPELKIIEQVMQDLQRSSPQSKNEARSVEAPQRGVSREAIAGATAETAEITGVAKVSNQPPDLNSAPPISSYAEWVARFFSHDVSSVLTSPGADPDRDGFSNWEEYGFGTSPIRSDSMPRAEFVRVRVGNEDYPAIQFRRRAKVEGLAYRLLFSSDLVSWNQISSSTLAVSAPDAEGLEAVTIRALTPMSGAQQQFLRVDLPMPEDLLALRPKVEGP